MGNTTIKCSHTYYIMDAREVRLKVNLFKQITLLLCNANSDEFYKIVTYGKKSCNKCDNVIYFKQNEKEPWKWNLIKEKPDCFNTQSVQLL
jgi:hypothetical protein